MDVRKVFQLISEQLLTEFMKTSEIRHSGGKGALREDALRKFLETHLPGRYAVGQGEVITAENEISGQLDIVIYEPTHCPALIVNTAHSVFPIESVFGAISVKSTLDSTELAQAYQNIISLKKIVPSNGFQHDPGPGSRIGLYAPFPVTGIVAYTANRSLEAIAAQIRELDANLDELSFRPDFVAVLGLGIVGPRHPIRDSFNKRVVPTDVEELTAVRSTGRHTLMRLLMQIVRELNTITLRPLDLSDYEDMPRRVGEFRVRRHDIFVRENDGEDQPAQSSRLTEKAIRKIVSESIRTTLHDLYMHAYGNDSMLPQDRHQDMIFEYNPNRLPPIPETPTIRHDTNGRPVIVEAHFHPHELIINGDIYAVDLSSLSADDWETNPDLTADELFAN